MAFVFHDFETQSDLDLPVVGTLKYVLDPSTRPLLWSWAVDDGPVLLWCPNLYDELAPEVWEYVIGRMHTTGEGPSEMHGLFRQPDTYAVAHNSSFDRAVWQQIATPEYGFPKITIEQTLCSLAQAQASNLPGQLDWAGRKLSIGTKTLGGKAVMKRFADRKLPLPGARTEIDAAPNRQAAIARAIEAWALYIDYSVQDTDLLRSVWRACRQLTAEEWQVYWVSERINDRGLPVDLDVCKGAMAYREEEAEHVKAELTRLTDGAITSPTLTLQINKWLYERLPDDLAANMIKAVNEETGEVTKITGAKDVMTRLLEDIQQTDTPPEDAVVEVLELLQFGRSSAAVKFEKMFNQSVDARLTNSYVFNGAGQTGRYSSRGVQVHNLPRDFFPNELDLLDMVAARVPIEELRKFGPVSSVLSKLIRPTFVAPEGKVFVWGDWSQIEARVTPWLANNRDAERAVLDLFRASDEDKSRPDVYVHNAESIFNIPAETIWERVNEGDKQAKSMRQAAKVAVLALGFAGGVGAYKAMARGYGMRVSDEDAKTVVDGWRDRNKWARRYAYKCEEAAFSAMETPMTLFKAGRLSYQFVPGLMGGTLICHLPCGRPIVYPRAEIKPVEKFGEMANAITYLNGMGYRSLWSGLQVENGTQAAAASILRGTLLRLDVEEKEVEVMLHTHDEVGAEISATSSRAFAERLESVMVRGFEWTTGLPLAAEVSTSWYYTKQA